MEKEKKKRLLIVDDFDEVREIFHDWFKDCFEICETADGLDAVGLFEEFKPDLVFLDGHLRDSDPVQGIDLLSHMKRRNPSAIVCVISADSSLKNELLKAGADAFFEKPCSMNELCQFLISKGLMEKKK